MNESRQSPFRVLVIANEAVDGRMLHGVLAEHAGEARPADVLLVCPALNSRLRFWVSDVDPARRAAADRLRESLLGLEGDGIEVEGSVGDSDPLQALVDGLRMFEADEIVLVTHAEEEAHWVEHGLVERARARVDGLPIVHVVVSDRRLHAAA
ncbi:MAG TPA: hypothetical protein VGM80_08885 [Gaiellaceae bacterium]